MFRRILQRTPGRGGSQSSDSDSSAAPGNVVDVNNEGSSEGFICPLCMKVCVAPTDLSEHYQSEHTGMEGRRELRDLSAISGFICPLCMKSHGSAEELFKHYEAVHNSGIDSTHRGEGHLSPER
ncbi:early endosome antigen 1 [Malurus melanocephalus]|uniref:early endosome antigen 1 n=1 Tax=Malurus melanocephalus TaxID=175006 RepID=UPI002548B6FC|nr:early endosome antigen 1 [Malurus melanocephalus]